MTDEAKVSAAGRDEAIAAAQLWFIAAWRKAEAEGMTAVERDIEEADRALLEAVVKIAVARAALAHDWFGEAATHE